MAWSAGLTTIRLPYDAVPGGGKNYVDIGEDVPPELTNVFTAGLFFRNGTPPSFPNGFDYWAIGITASGKLEVIGRYYVIPAPGGDPQYFRRSVLTFAPPFAVDNPPVLAIGGHSDYSAYTEGPTPQTVLAQPFPPLRSESPIVGPGPAGYTASILGPGFIHYAGFGLLTIRQLATGEINVQGLVQNVFGSTLPSGSVVILQMPVWARPNNTVVTNEVRDVAIAGGRVDFMPNGTAVMLTWTLPNNSYIGFNRNYYPDN